MACHQDSNDYSGLLMDVFEGGVCTRYIEESDVVVCVVRELCYAKGYQYPNRRNPIFFAILFFSCRSVIVC